MCVEGGGGWVGGSTPCDVLGVMHTLFVLVLLCIWDEPEQVLPGT